MIAYDFSSESQRVRMNYYNLLSPAGRAHLALLLQKEKDILESFILSYETSQLRRLEAKAKKEELTDDEKKLLKKGKKSFKGVLATGGLIENESSLKVVNEYLDCLDIIEDDLKVLESFAGLEGQQNSEVVLGKQMSYWNLHPNQFSVSVYESLFDSPEYTKQELYKLFNMKVGSIAVSQPAKVFGNKKEVEQLLNNYVGSETEKASVTDKLLNLYVVGDVATVEYKNTIVRLINLLIEKDAEFDYLVYKDLKPHLPQYHNKKTKYFIYMLAQYNHTESVAVSSRIDFTTLQAFYRKADELCSS